MNTEQYQRLAERTSATATNGGIESSKKQITRGSDVIRLLHGAIGLCTEAGELQDQLKRHVFYGSDLDLTNIKEECGDILWYVAEILNALGVSMSEVMQANIDKLRERFPDKFDSVKAIKRDLDAERAVLEAVSPPVGAGDGLVRDIPDQSYPNFCAKCRRPIHRINTSGLCPDCYGK